MKKLLTFAIIVFMAAMQVIACAAITRKGTQCKRPPSPGSKYCWQHGGTTAAQRAAGITEADVAKMRCKATTKVGTQCKRTAITGSKFCWQHQSRNSTSPTVSDSISTDTMPISTARQQCEAITKKGTRCSRAALSNSKYCWQHDK